MCLVNKIETKSSNPVRIPVVAPAPDPFAAYGPRIEAATVSDVAPGQRGKRIGINDLKVG